MSATRTSKYQIKCPYCKEYFAWSHVCLKKKGNNSAIRGVGDNRMKIIAWVNSK